MTLDQLVQQIQQIHEALRLGIVALGIASIGAVISAVFIGRRN